MKILFWNLRGLGAPGRKKKLRELIFDHRLDVVCLQETIKQSFSEGELKTLGGDLFNW